MTSENKVDEFLRAEETASLLVDELEALKREADSYHSATGHLDSAAAEVGGLVNGLAVTSERLKEVVEKLGTIGTPALLESQQAISARLDDVVERNDRQESVLAAEAQTLAELRQIIAGHGEELKASATRQEAAASMLQGLVDRASEQETAIEVQSQALTELRELTTGYRKEFSASTARQEAGLLGLKRIVALGFGANLAAFAIVIALIIT